MNVDAASNAGSGSGPNQRKERGAIAAQACDICRSRKQRCDEQRPKCGLCSRMKIECRYREPLPTKKDKTLVEILDRLTRLEIKIDSIPGVQTLGQQSILGLTPAQSSSSSQISFAPDRASSASYSTTFSNRSQSEPRSSQYARGQPYRHASAAHKMLTWPAIEQLLVQAMPSNIADINSLEQEGSAFIIRLQKGTPGLPLDEYVADSPFVGMQSQANRKAGGGPRVIFPGLGITVMNRLANAYFNTFNFLYPFMDRQTFMTETLNRVYTEGFDGDTDSVIALLIFALGELSIAGEDRNPIETSDRRGSGLRGGSLERPPGLALFNEARKRLGFVMAECNLENVQIFSLAALYYQSCSRHVDFWRLTVNASNACEVLITTNPIDWESSRGDLVKRAYWHCMIMETGLHLELDLPVTTLIWLEDRVGLPSFSGSYSEQDYHGNQISHFEKHYASQLALRRLCATLHNDINASMSATIEIPSETNEDFAGPTISTLKRLAASLTQWLDILPLELRWPEDDPTTMPLDPTMVTHGHIVDPALNNNRKSLDNIKMFSTSLQHEPIHYEYAYDIQTALLRTRYSYAKYMVYRPFVYKALHFPDQMTRDDYQGAAYCLRACLRWPICMSPTAHHKHLVPYLFCWSQNFLGILLILHLSRYAPCLVHIRQSMCGANFEEEVSQSVGLMLEWIRDLKSSDPIALWCWNILKGVYHLDD